MPDEMDGELVRVIAPYFVAGIIFEDGKAVYAAPILRWALGMEFWPFRQYCLLKKRWKLEHIK